MSSHTATFYVQIEPEWSRYPNENGDKTVSAIKAIAVTQKQPRSPRGGTLSMKLSVEVPDGAFMPLRPEAVIVIPEGMAIVNPIEVTVEDPT